eukprot:11170789-Lingulodinium_polyedra.AAC.1
MALTPDGDVCPHCLAAPPLSGLQVYDEKEEAIRDRRAGARLAEAPYSDDWSPTSREFQVAM